ncbi:restriction endonuclease subunit S [Legionella geestiana]|uniref:restriction endonuclease subunit S n=1 Tax=Legionella geestiana TaxID=45065 RepID=UPI001C9E3F5E|nr:restriction endonuclease subunit S [Legionella geestiana]
MIKDHFLPNGWVECQIEDLISPEGVFRDGDWIESKDQDPDGEVRLIQLADIGDGVFVNKSSRYLTRDKARQLNCTFLEKEDLLVARMPDPLGRSCIFPLVGEKKFVTVVDICILRAGNNCIDRKFLMFLINSILIREQINTLQSGSTRKRISRKNLATIKFPIAPLNEQKRIVAKIEELFSELDNGIAALKTAREQLKVYRQAVLKHAFEGKLTANWREANADKLETPEKLLARIQQERNNRYQHQLQEWEDAVKKWEAQGKEGKKPGKPKTPDASKTLELADNHYLSGIPKEWISVKAEHLCDFITKGTTPEKSELFSNAGDVPFIKVYNLTKSSALNFSIDPTYVSHMTHNGFLARSKVYPNDVLMNIVGPPLGKVSIVPDCFTEWNINQAIAIYRSNILSPRYLAEFLLFEKTVNFMMSKSKATAGQFNLTLEICRELPIPVTIPEEQYEIVKQLEEQFSNLDSVSKEIDEQLLKAETLRQSILKKAFSGNLVQQDPNDEPAIELLERIKAEKEQQKYSATKPAPKPRRKKFV